MEYSIVIFIAVAISVIYFWVISLFARMIVKAILKKDFQVVFINILVLFVLLLFLYHFICNELHLFSVY